jgi:hypothetical protein
MSATEPSTVLQSASTGELDAIALSLDVESSAMLRGVQAELADRTAAWKSGFMFASQIEQLQAALAVKEDKIFELQLEINMLEDELQEAQKGKAKGKA